MDGGEQMFKTIPTVTIGGHTYTIELKDASAVSQYGHQGDGHAQAMSIRVATGLIDGGYRNLTDIEEVLLHELVHQISIVWDVQMEEEDVERMAQGLVQVLPQFGCRLVQQI